MTGQASGARVLVVDDDRSTLLILRRTVASWGYQVHAAPSGEQALELLAEPDIRIVISDWEMPGLTGVELCRRLRRERTGPYIYFILLTHRQSKESVVQGLDAGADDFLPKPFDPLELRARVAVGTRIVKLEDDLQDKTRELETINQHLASMAATDHLMAIGNRRAFEAAADRLHAVALRQGIAYAVAMADVDQFKAYNDHHGHQQGDRVLALIASTLRHSIRGGDEIFRYGGEEIVLLTQFHDAATLGTMLERLRAAVEGLGEPHEGNAGAGVLTVSFGGAVFAPRGASGSATGGWPGVVKRADDALYQAKRAGRNRVVIAPDTG